MFTLSKSALRHISHTNVNVGDSLLLVPSTLFFLTKIVKSLTKFSIFNIFIKGFVFGRFGLVACGFPMSLKSVLYFETATLLLVKAFDSMFFKFYSLIRGYFRNIFLSVNRGFRKTIYQYGLGYKSFLYPFQHCLVFKVGRSSRSYIQYPTSVYLLQRKKRRRRIVRFTPYKDQLLNIVSFLETEKPAAAYDPRKGVYVRGKFYLTKKSGKLARKGRKKK